jgi:hypothetical protein
MPVNDRPSPASTSRRKVRQTAIDSAQNPRRPKTFKRSVLVPAAQHMLLVPSNYPGVVYAIRDVTLIRSWLTAGLNTRGSSTTKLPWNDHGCSLDLKTLMLEKPIYDVRRTRCQVTIPGSSSFYKYPSQMNCHT